MRGNISNLAAFSKLLKFASISRETHKINGSGNANLLRFRLFSSVDGQSRNGQFKKGGRDDYSGRRNDYDYDNDDKFSGRKGGNFGGGHHISNPGSGGRPNRGERHRNQFGGGNGGESRDNRRQGRRNDGYGKPFGGDGFRGSMKLDDDVLNFGGNDERGVGLAGENGGRKDDQPASVRELLNSPLEGEQRRGKEGGDGEFLEKFKLGGVGKEEENQSNDGIHNPLANEEKMEEPEGADEIFNKMKKNGLIPNAVAMLDGLCQDGLVHEAMKLFGLMREKGTMPEVVVYTAVVEGFCKAEKLDDAKRIFKKMQSNGIVPNAFSYTILIKGLCKGKRLDDATDVCVEMLEAGHSPNVPTFTGLVHEFCKEKGVEEARKIVSALKQKGFYLDEKSVRIYLDKTGPASPMVWEAIFGPKKTTERAI